MAAASNTIKVTNLSAATDQVKLEDFFKFCGEIEKTEITGTEATIIFKRPQAVETAKLFDNHELYGSAIKVEVKSTNVDHDDAHGHGEPTQADKPRAAIIAEYLAHGYILKDSVLQRATKLDQEKNISPRFLGFLKGWDETIGSKLLGPDKTVSAHVMGLAQTATDKAKEIDQQRGITQSAYGYLNRALSNPKVRSFYETTTNSATSIYEESLRIYEHKKASGEIPADAPPPAPPVLESSASHAQLPAPAATTISA